MASGVVSRKSVTETPVREYDFSDSIKIKGKYKLPFPVDHITIKRFNGDPAQVFLQIGEIPSQVATFDQGGVFDFEHRHQCYIVVLAAQTGAQQLKLVLGGSGSSTYKPGNTQQQPNYPTAYYSTVTPSAGGAFLASVSVPDGVEVSFLADPDNAATELIFLARSSADSGADATRIKLKGGAAVSYFLSNISAVYAKSSTGAGKLIITFEALN